jgi:ssDNA-binding replication factor A large subunit
MKTHEVEHHEVVFADGGSMLISELRPLMKGNWRIRVRLVKKNEIKTWKNDKGEGSLMNLDFMDRVGTKMQGTLFKDLIQVYEPTLIVGNCYEISQGTVKNN